MDQTHIHLLITHLPIFGSLIGAIVLAHALWFKSRSAKIAAYNVMILSAIGGIIAYLTGEAAEETAEHLPGVTRAIIHEHEEFAGLTIFAIAILGGLALIGLFLQLRNKRRNGFGYLVFITSLVCFGMTSYTGFLGGQIRHTEIRSGSANTANDSGDEEMQGDEHGRRGHEDRYED